MRDSSSQRFAEREFVKSVSLSAPPVRMVVLAAELHGDQNSQVAVLPVLAIETAVVWHWIRREPGQDKYGVPLNDQELRAEGYQFVGEQVRRELIVFDDKHGDGLVSVGELWRPRNVVVLPVVCDWPPSKDKSRFAPIIAELIEQQKREVSRA